MNLSKATFSEHGNNFHVAEVLTRSDLSIGNSFANTKDTFTNTKRLGSSLMIGLAVSGTMGVVNFIEYQVPRKTTANTYDVQLTDRPAAPKITWLSGLNYEISLSLNKYISGKDLEALHLAILQSYGDVRVDISIHTDPEEGWSKPVFTVYSGLDDFERLMDVEDAFFASADVNPVLHKILPSIIISQA